MAYKLVVPLVGSCAALAVAWMMVLTYNLLIRSILEISAVRRHEAWKKEILKAWRR